jgi:hypothetical protein
MDGYYSLRGTDSMSDATTEIAEHTLSAVCTEQCSAVFTFTDIVTTAVRLTTIFSQRLSAFR